MGWLIDGQEETRGANRYGGERVTLSVVVFVPVL